MAEDAGGVPRASLAALFAGFLKLAFGGAGGGGIVFARRLVVDEQAWMGEHDFVDILSLCQFLPGPNIVGIAVCVGARLRGPAGALASLAGFTVIPLTISFSLGVWCLRHASLAILGGGLGGVSAVAAGLLIATGLRLLAAHCTRPGALLIAALAFVGLVFTKLPLVAVLLVLTPLSVAAAVLSGWRER